MRRRSIVGPIILVVVGALFLAYNLRPDIAFFDLVSVWWPFLLIAWGVLRLIEVGVAFARSPQTARITPSLTAGEIALIVVICLVGSGLFQAHRHGIRIMGPGGLEMFGQAYDYNVAEQKPAAGVKRVIFDNLRGNVRVTGADTQDIKVTGRKTVRAFNQSDADRANSRTPVEIVPEGDRIIVRASTDEVNPRQRVSTDLDVIVPRGAAIEAHGRYGDFDVTDITGDVDIQTDRGDVRLNRVAGNAHVEARRSDLVRAVDLKGALELQGRGSDIELENIAGQVSINGSYGGTLEFKNVAKPLHFESQNTDLRVEALPGRISVDLSEITGNNMVGPVRLITKSRDVKMQDFTQSLELETERGDIELEPGRVPLPKIDARSRTGRIDLVLPAKGGFTLSATTSRGDVQNDFGAPLEKQVDGPSATLKGKVGQGPDITVTTERGSVQVRKAGAAAPVEAKF